MRIRPYLLIVLLATSAAPVAAQTAPGQGPAPGTGPLQASVGQIDFGVRLNTVDGDAGRFQRLRDQRTGPTLDRLRYARSRNDWDFNAQFDHVGYRDQRYFASIERPGRLRASFDWNQVPLFYSDISTTPYREDTPNVFRLEDTTQAAVQNRTATIASYASELRQFDMRSRRDTAAARFSYSATPELDLTANFTSTARTGEQPWGAPFGFSNTVTLPLSLDMRANDLTTAAEWSNSRGMARLAYDGSFFNNNLESVLWDNPLRFSDQTNATAYSTGEGAAQGRMALFPDSTAHTVSASGSVALPARSRAFAYVSVGSWLQDEELLPYTVNSAIQPIPLARDSVEAEARITAMNYRFTSRPTRTLWLSGQYRLYDFENRTPRFAVSDYVRLDGTVAPSATGGSHPFDYSRDFVDLDASLTPFRFVAFRLGYGLQHDDRSYRLFEQTTDQTVRASVDSTGFSWGSVRLQYDRSHRSGDGLDEEVLSEIGEQVSLRQFDIANRTRDRLTGIFQAVPLASLGFNASVAIGQENRPDSAFGLQDNDLRAVTFQVDYTPDDRITAGISYSFEKYATTQQSRQANPGPQFDDPTRDWWTDMDEHVNTLSFSVGLPQVTARTSATVGYDFVGSDAQYLYRLRPGSTLPGVQQLPSVRNVFHVANVNLRHTLSRQLALGVGYRFDHYDVEDFAVSPGTLNSPLLPTFVNVLYQWRPYDAHTGYVRLMYNW